MRTLEQTYSHIRRQLPNAPDEAVAMMAYSMHQAISWTIRQTKRKPLKAKAILNRITNQTTKRK